MKEKPNLIEAKLLTIKIMEEMNMKFAGTKEQYHKFGSNYSWCGSWSPYCNEYRRCISPIGSNEEGKHNCVVFANFERGLVTSVEGRGEIEVDAKKRFREVFDEIGNLSLKYHLGKNKEGKVAVVVYFWFNKKWHLLSTRSFDCKPNELKKSMIRKWIQKELKT